MNFKKIGKAIKIARIRSNMTQVQLCQKTGFSQKRISRYENGLVKIGIDSLERIAMALRMPPSYFIESD